MRRLERAAFRKKRKLSSQMGVKGQRGEPFPGGLLFSSCPSMTLLGMRASVLETLIMPATKGWGARAHEFLSVLQKDKTFQSLVSLVCQAVCQAP